MVKDTPDQNKFCGKCGTRLPEPKNYCPKCNITYKNEIFCTHCGTKLVNKKEYQNQILEQKIKDSLLWELYLQFKYMNDTTNSIFDLGEYEVLIILKNGINLTDWNDVKNFDDILYISEDFSNKSNVNEYYGGLSSVKFIALSNIRDNVKDMHGMFSDCTSLEGIFSFGKFNVSNVTDMNGLFENCFSLIDISSLANWDVSNVEDMSNMFFSCESLEDISSLANWDVSKLKDGYAMFCCCESLLNISPLTNWKTSMITQLGQIFAKCGLLEDIMPLSNWKVSNVENMEEMFLNCESLKDIVPLRDWDVGHANNMHRMFEGCISLTDICPLNDWNVIYSCNIKKMFDKIPKLKNYPNWYTNMNRKGGISEPLEIDPIVRIHIPQDLYGTDDKQIGEEFIEGKTKEELEAELEFVTRKLEDCLKNHDYMAGTYREKKILLERELRKFKS